MFGKRPARLGAIGTLTATIAALLVPLHAAAAPNGYDVVTAACIAL